MKLIIPNNIFATLFILAAQNKIDPEISVKESSLISKELDVSKDSIAMIPSFDLINHRDLYVSSKYGLGFDGLLSNSYIYFGGVGREVNEILLRGDISTNDVVLSKIVFKERYNIQPQFSLDSKDFHNDRNYLICGNENWVDDKYTRGSSFSELIFDLIEFPYINYVFASKSENNVKNFHKELSGITDKIRLNIKAYLGKIGLNESINSLVENELNSVYFDFTESENTALSELLQFAYFHKFLDDLFDVKFIT